MGHRASPTAQSAGTQVEETMQHSPSRKDAKRCMVEATWIPDSAGQTERSPVASLFSNYCDHAMH